MQELVVIEWHPFSMPTQYGTMKSFNTVLAAPFSACFGEERNAVIEKSSLGSSVQLGISCFS